MVVNVICSTSLNSSTAPTSHDVVINSFITNLNRFSTFPFRKFSLSCKIVLVPLLLLSTCFLKTSHYPYFASLTIIFTLLHCSFCILHFSCIPLFQLIHPFLLLHFNLFLALLLHDAVCFLFVVLHVPMNKRT